MEDAVSEMHSDDESEFQPLANLANNPAYQSSDQASNSQSLNEIPLLLARAPKSYQTASLEWFARALFRGEAGPIDDESVPSEELVEDRAAIL